jgi:hypothetical protein
MEENQVRKSLTKFASSGTPKQNSYRQALLKNAAKAKDTRNQALKDLDAMSDELQRQFSRPSGTFDPKEEMKKEDEVLKDLEKSELPEERKKEYLYLLKKRMRTA